MSATNSTTKINLPVFLGTDKPSWLVDWNGAMNIIDAAIAQLQSAEGGTATALASLAQSVQALSGTVEQHTTALQTATQAIAGNTGSINTINSLIGNGQPTTTDKTIIGAINEINAKIPEGGTVNAEDVAYDNTDSGISATNVQGAIDNCVSTDVIREGEIANNRTNIGYLMDYTLNKDIPIGTKGNETVYRHIFEGQYAVPYQSWANVYATDINPSKILSVTLVCDTTNGTYTGGQFIQAKIEDGYVKLLQTVDSTTVTADWVVTIEFTKASA